MDLDDDDLLTADLIEVKPKRQRKKKDSSTEMKDTSYKTIELLENQDSHVQNILKIFSERPFALDLSMLGAGKTFTST